MEREKKRMEKELGGGSVWKRRRGSEEEKEMKVENEMKK